MSYSNAWSDTIPLGSELASHIDDQIRQLRLDIHERMNTLVTDWTADPVVLINPASTDNSRLFEYHLFFPVTSSLMLLNVGAFLPSNCTVTRIQGWVEWISGSITQKFFAIPFAGTGTPTPDSTLSTVTVSTGGSQLMDTGVVSFPLNTGKYYMLQFEGSGNFGTTWTLYSAQITFTR